MGKKPGFTTWIGEVELEHWGRSGLVLVLVMVMVMVKRDFILLAFRYLRKRSAMLFAHKECSYLSRWG